MNKLLSCRYNMDTNRVEARFTDGSAVAIDQFLRQLYPFSEMAACLHKIQKTKAIR